MRILIVEEALRLGNGHWPRYVADLAAGFRAEGDVVEVLGHREANEKVKSVVPNVVTWLSRDCRADARSQGLIGGIRHNLCLKRELGAWLKGREPYDWILSLSSRPKHLLAFAMLARARYCARSRFLLLFVISPGQQDEAGKFRLSASNLFAKFCLALLRPAVCRGQVVIAAETQVMQAEIGKFSELRTVLFPHPVEAAQTREENAEKLKAEMLKKDGTTKDTSPARQRIAQGEVECVGWEPTGAKRSEGHERGEEVSTTIERQGGREKEQPKVGPKGEGVGTTESNDTDEHGYQKNQQSDAQGTCAGSVFSDPSTSELARDSEKTPLTRSPSIPAVAMRAETREMGSAGENQLADSKEFLDGQSQAGLQMDNQKGHTIRTVNAPSASGEYSSSVSIRDIRGQNSDALDAGRSALDSKAPATSYPQPATSTKPLLVVAPGLARYEKGSDIFQEAIKLILSNKVASDKWQVASAQNQSAEGLSEPVTNYSLPATAAMPTSVPRDPFFVPVVGRPLKFVFQWPEDFDLPDGRRCAPDHDLLKDERVKFSKDLLTGEAYWDFLQQADVIVLPYRSESYRARVSRVAIEAAMLGKPMVYTKGTWISEVVEMVGAGVAIAEEIPQSLAEAIQMAIGDLDMLQSEAECGVERVRKFYSVSSFHHLLGELGGNKKNNISE